MGSNRIRKFAYETLKFRTRWFETFARNACRCVPIICYVSGVPPGNSRSHHGGKGLLSVLWFRCFHFYKLERIALTQSEMTVWKALKTPQLGVGAYNEIFLISFGNLFSCHDHWWRKVLHGALPFLLVILGHFFSYLQLSWQRDVSTTTSAWWDCPDTRGELRYEYDLIWAWHENWKFPL